MKTISILAVLITLSSNAYATPHIDENKAVLAIIGEAEDQGYLGMLAVAGAIRNRGTLTGVYGKDSKRARNAPQWLINQAKTAWLESKTHDITLGATHWESDRFKEPYWAKSMKKTVKIKNHQFYK